LGIGDWGLGIGPNPQSPIPNPQSPTELTELTEFIINIIVKYYKNIKNKIKTIIICIYEV